MTNRPCLDMEKAIGLIKGYCQIKGYETDELVGIIKKSFIGWYSRSVASAVFVFCKNKNGKWCVLASERGEDAADFQGYWNCPCGYLDFDETAAGAARRECYEETGVNLDINKIKCVSYEDDPVTANRQNVTFRFVCIIDDKTTDKFVFSKKNNEGKEVGRIDWVTIDDVKMHKWAFNHEERINEIFEQYVDPNGKYRFWNKVRNFFNGIGGFLSDF